MKIVCFVSASSWVLNSGMRKLAEALNRASVNAEICDLHGDMPSADYYFYSVRDHLLHHAQKYRGTFLSQSCFIHTHLEEANFKHAYIFKQCAVVFFMNKKEIDVGCYAMSLHRGQAAYLPWPVDPEIFFLKRIKDEVEELNLRPTVGFSLKYQPDNPRYASRKNYEVVLGVARGLANAGLAVEVLGPNWEVFNKVHNLSGRLRFREDSYVDYNRIYNCWDYVCSLSSYEGGPVGVLEAMRAGCYPILSKTGHFEEVLGLSSSNNDQPFITENGCHLPVGESVDTYISQILYVLDQVSISSVMRRRISKNALAWCPERGAKAIIAALAAHRM